MIIDISNIIIKNNITEKFDCSIDARDITYNRITYPIINSKPFELSVVNQDSKVVSISCDTSLEVSIPCDRCMTDVSYPFDISIDKSFKIVDEKVVLEDEEAYFNDNELDVDRLIFDEVLVNWPAKVLCKEDCKGMCPNCGTNLNTSSCDCVQEIKDPRMAKFQEVFREFKEV
ncbi:MAG: DUF177 domain-containing protein [Lachnospiraceae bacterium]|nr:DUF177 domain-containing protein [Lachnospiraceae bacterium]